MAEQVLERKSPHTQNCRGQVILSAHNGLNPGAGFPRPAVRSLLSSGLLQGFNLVYCSLHPQSKLHILIPAERPCFYSHLNAISVQG